MTAESRTPLDSPSGRGEHDEVQCIGCVPAGTFSFCVFDRSGSPCRRSAGPVQIAHVMDRQGQDGATPWRWLLGLHPPWVHWSFWMIWSITASLGPIAFVVGLLSGSDKWWIGLAIYAVALVTIGIDSLSVRR